MPSLQRGSSTSMLALVNLRTMFEGSPVVDEPSAAVVYEKIEIQLMIMVGNSIDVLFGERNPPQKNMNCKYYPYDSVFVRTFVTIARGDSIIGWY